MSVRRKGPKATAVRVATYVLLVVVAVVVVFPFAVAVTTAFKRNTDIFTYPPSLVPKKEATIPAADVGLEGDPVPVYTFPDRDDRPGQWALVDGDASLAEFRPLDDLERVVVLDVKAGEKTGETITIEGEEEDVYLIDDGGTQIEAYRSRLTSGGLFVSVDDPSTSVLDLVNFATPAREFGPRFSNFTEVLAEKDPETNGKGVGRSLTNTVLVTILVVLGQIITSILGGYAFARVQFKGRSTIFLMYLGSVMIPFVVLIIPLFQLMLQVNWRDNLVALIIPFAFTAYGTFLMRQFFLGIPAEIEEAALLDGASRSTILWKVMVPLARPAIATLATFGFLYAWNSFFWPLVIINSGNPDNAVLSLTLSTLGGRSSTDTNLVFAGTVLAMTPPILVFLFAQRYFVENSASSGLK
jgi:ABC-type glycerol-3-phosphate transport system permease component